MKKISENSIFFGSYTFFLGLAAVIAAVAVIVSSPVLRMTKDQTARLADSEAPSAEKYPRIIIDAGHGGEDGGAVAPDGTCEKDINLNIAKYTYEYLTSLGFDCVLSRDDDVMLSDGEGSTKKMRDLKNRVALTEDGDCIFVSIHQNKFPQDTCSGAQVYYSKNDPKSADLARTAQEYLRRYLQPQNTRQIKPAGSEIFVLDRCAVPAVLIECGFLSNPAELLQLKTDEYQKKLGCVIALSVTDFLSCNSEAQGIS